MNEIIFYLCIYLILNLPFSQPIIIASFYCLRGSNAIDEYGWKNYRQAGVLVLRIFSFHGKNCSFFALPLNLKLLHQ